MFHFFMEYLHAFNIQCQHIAIHNSMPYFYEKKIDIVRKRIGVSFCFDALVVQLFFDTKTQRYKDTIIP
jgi:hypothetical protein